MIEHMLYVQSVSDSENPSEYPGVLLSVGVSDCGLDGSVVRLHMWQLSFCSCLVYPIPLISPESCFLESAQMSIKRIIGWLHDFKPRCCDGQYI